MSSTVSQSNPMFPKGAQPGAKADSDPASLPEREKLSNLFPTKYTAAMIAGVVINIAMLLYSHLGLSAVIKSAVCPEGFDGCPDPIDATNLVDACVNPQDLAILVPGSQALDEVPLYMSVIGLDCLGQDQCIVDAVMELHGLTRECASCYALAADCAVEFCFLPCISNSLSPNCLRCNAQNCDPVFELCTGVEFPPNTNFSQSDPPGDDDDDGPVVIFVEGEDCFERDQFELFKVFNLTFINSIEEAIVGGSLPLALLIVVASGVWPYTKNGLMLYAWLAPLTRSRRDAVFRVLTILGKWSLVDVFAVVVIINGVVIQKVLSGDSPLIVFAESRPGIYMFGIAAIWALTQGEVMRYLVKHRFQTDATGKAQTLPLSPERSFKLKLWKVLCAVSAALSFWFGLLGVFGLNISFVLEGRITEFVGINSFGYSTVDMASGLVDDCAIYGGHESVAGARFLAFLFLLLVAIIPLTSCVLLFLTAITFQPSRRETWLTSITFGLSNFASLDVFLLSVITLASQFEGLIEAAVGDGVDEQCGVTAAASANGEFCIKFLGTIEAGTWFILLSTLGFWTSLFAGARLLEMTKEE